MTKEEVIHDISSYFHNVMHLLKYVEEDAVIDNDDTKDMLRMALGREDRIADLIKSLKDDGAMDIK